jgi:hypothetical protein
MRTQPAIVEKSSFAHTSATSALFCQTNLHPPVPELSAGHFPGGNGLLPHGMPRLSSIRTQLNPHKVHTP